MRMTSTQTGEVLISTSVTKTIISSGSSMGVFKFFDMGTSSFEAEAGHTINEPVNYAVRVAIEQAVVELIKAGETKGLWKYTTRTVQPQKVIKPLPFQDALKKWPQFKESLDCDANNYCKPK
jgi:curli biogenesis system outer membrane secretion channel CsgG